MRTRAGRKQRYQIDQVLIKYTVTEKKKIKKNIVFWTIRCTEHNASKSEELWLTFVTGQ
jgi:hypothetical protein